MRPSVPTRVSLGVGLVAFAVYAATACRTITWWDGSSHPLAALTLGVAPAPGGLLLTLLGWLLTRIRFVHPPAFQLNLVAALIGATTAGLVARLATRSAARGGEPIASTDWIAGACAGLVFAFCVTPWTYGVQFTPYGLSACFTALILTAAWAWWERPERSAGLFLFFLLVGLDFSVHRTNLLLLPAALAWVALRRSPPRPLRLLPIPLAGLLAGFAFHLLLVPIARAHPVLDLGDPGTLRGLWSYVSMAEKGGGFLIQIYPRTAGFLDVQLGDYVRFLARNLAPGRTGFAWLPAAILSSAGLVATLRADARRSIGWLGFYACASLGAVVYFNLPAHFFRSMDRHYLPSLVVLAPLLGAGAAVLLRGARRASTAGARVLVALLGGLLALAPLALWRTNRAACDLSRTRFTETLSRAVLEPLPARAILLTNGDNDTFPLWYLQEVEGVRRDVAVINLPSTNAGWYVEQLRRRDPEFAPLLEGERLGLLVAPGGRDTTLRLAVDRDADLALAPGTPRPDSVAIRVAPFAPGAPLYGQDRVIMDLLRLNRWRRPVVLASTVDRSNLSWLWPHARLDPSGFRVMPTTEPGPPDLAAVRRALFERSYFAGLADRSIALDEVSGALASNLSASLFQLAVAQIQGGDRTGCLETLSFLERNAPPDRFGSRGGEIREAVEGLRRKLEAVPETAGAPPG